MSFQAKQIINILLICFPFKAINLFVYFYYTLLFFAPAPTNHASYSNFMHFPKDLKCSIIIACSFLLFIQPT